MKFISSFRHFIASKLPLKNYILFESLPDYTDNTFLVFSEMKNREINKKYTLIWMRNSKHSNNSQYLKQKHIKSVYRQSLLGRYYHSRAKCLISCNLFLKSIRDGQYSLFLNHGTALKTTTKYYVLPDNITQVLAASEESNMLTSKYFKYDTNKSIILGFPRNDVFATPPKNIRQIVGNYSKIIAWYPTFRQHKNGMNSTGKNALPILHDNEKAFLLNETLKRENTLIIIKPHFVQDLSYIKDLNLSNILFITDDWLPEHQLSSYEFLNACDALITDYSSVYYDYLLCNKPIGAVWEDIEEYSQFPGLIDNYEYYMGGAEKIYTIEDMIGFVERVAKEEDVLYEKRNQLKLLMNYSDDGQNTKRVVDYIETVLNNK